MKIVLPKLSLVVLMGPSGAGKSSFARKHFLPTEILSSDVFRGLVSDDENNQAASAAAFDVLHTVASRRLERGLLTVIDATNVQPEARAPLVALARQYHCLPVAIVLDLPDTLCHERNRLRPERAFGPHVVRQQRQQLRRSLGRLKREGFRQVTVLRSVDDIDAATIERVPLWNDRSDETGPFDIIGDIHGCADELEQLLQQLGYEAQDVLDAGPGWDPRQYVHPAGRRVIFLGDLVDRGPRNVAVLSLARNMVQAGAALCVPGNHDVKLLKKLRGRDVQIAHGLAATLTEITALPESVRGHFCDSAARFLDGLVSHYVLDQGRLVVAHAGMKASMQGRGSSRVRDFALYGETTGETDEFGMPVRLNWALDYRGSAQVVYGHTPIPEPEWLNRTINIDTGCVFGGKLTALRYPENELVSVPARRTYCEPTRPFLPAAEQDARTAQQLHDDVLDLADVTGRRIVTTGLCGSVTIRPEQSAAALEVMSRFAVSPQWLIYLPPTMAPCETTSQPGWLEHPAEAFAYFRSVGVPRVECQEKHMGSRAIVVVCRDERAARERFGATQGESGIVYTRTGRRFFSDESLELGLLDRVRQALSAARVWDTFQTTWVCLDCELMPWSAKAQKLLRLQYAAVGASGGAALARVVPLLEQATLRLPESGAAPARDALDRFRQMRHGVGRFVDAYREYCWPVLDLDDLKLAPFHLLATEGRVHVNQGHAWHLDRLEEIVRQDPRILRATARCCVEVTDPASENAGISWWESLTERGGEGMVVKPADYVLRGPSGVVQPAVKCRGREYLRLIYGPDYTAEEHLVRLRRRGLGFKRSLALREFALGLEGLERFVRREPLRRVHECVFGVLALESEPVDPRL